LVAPHDVDDHDGERDEDEYDDEDEHHDAGVGRHPGGAGVEAVGVDEGVEMTRPLEVNSEIRGTMLENNITNQ
jgi:hypothetical protein